MYYTYVLQNKKDREFYTSHTKNLKLRFEDVSCLPNGIMTCQFHRGENVSKEKAQILFNRVKGQRALFKKGV